MSKKKSKKDRFMIDLYQSIRRDWNGVNPVTKVMENKKRKKPKYKEEYIDQEQSIE